jgi:hypothetical protein
MQSNNGNSTGNASPVEEPCYQRQRRSGQVRVFFLLPICFLRLEKPMGLMQCFLPGSYNNDK